MVLPYEPPHNKINKMTCAPSEDSDQPGHPPIVISRRCPPEESLGPKLPIKRTAKTDQTGRMPQADLSLRLAHRSFCWFCHAMAHLNMSKICKWNVDPD